MAAGTRAAKKVAHLVLPHDEHAPPRVRAASVALAVLARTKHETWDDLTAAVEGGDEPTRQALGGLHILPEHLQVMGAHPEVVRVVALARPALVRRTCSDCGKSGEFTGTTVKKSCPFTLDCPGDLTKMRTLRPAVPSRGVRVCSACSGFTVYSDGSRDACRTTAKCPGPTISVKPGQWDMTAPDDLVAGRYPRRDGEARPKAGTSTDESPAPTPAPAPTPSPAPALGPEPTRAPEPQVDAAPLAPWEEAAPAPAAQPVPQAQVEQPAPQAPQQPAAPVPAPSEGAETWDEIARRTTTLPATDEDGWLL